MLERMCIVLYKNIIFDIDGTILDSEKAVLMSLRKVLLKETGHEYELDELSPALGITSEFALKQLGIKNVDEISRKWLNCYYDFFDYIKVFDGMENVLKKLHEMNIYMGIVTSKSIEEYTRDFAPFDIARYFNTVVCADDTEKHKPDPDPILKFFELSGADKSETIYIGDTDYDMACADGAGVDFALALWGAKHPEKVKAKYMLKSPEHILSLVNIK